MRAGALDQRVTLEQLVEGEDEAGQPFEDWMPVFDAWAAVEPLRGREVIRADAVANITDVLVKLRYRPGVLASMRIKHGSDTYSIATVINIKSANREVELCASGWRDPRARVGGPPRRERAIPNSWDKLSHLLVQ